MSDMTEDQATPEDNVRPQETEAAEQPEVKEGDVAEQQTPNETESKTEAEGQETSPVEDDKQDLGVMPVVSHVEQKAKWKQKVTESESEIEQLKREKAALEQEKQLLEMASSLTEPEKVGIPMELDYDTPEEYKTALDNYIAEKAKAETQNLLDQTAQQQQQVAQQQALEQQMDKAMDRHYEQASKLGAADYSQAEDVARQVMGDEVSKQIMLQFPEQSAAILYQLGKDQAKAQEISGLVQSDPLQGVIALTRYADSIGKIEKPTTPEPDEPNLSKGGSVSNWDAELDRLRKAKEKGKATQTDIMNLRKQAREAGHVFS